MVGAVVIVLDTVALHACCGDCCPVQKTASWRQLYSEGWRRNPMRCPDCVASATERLQSFGEGICAAFEVAAIARDGGWTPPKGWVTEDCPHPQFKHLESFEEGVECTHCKKVFLPQL